MNIENLEKELRTLTKSIDETSFIYDLLKAYGHPAASIARLKKGDYNLSKLYGEILWKKKLFFREEKLGDLHTLIDNMKRSPEVTKQKPRFIVVTDYETLLALDTKVGDTLDIPIGELSKHSDFFLPWAGMEKSQLQSESLADIRAAERMGKLYDIILEENPLEPGDEAGRHALNVFLARLLFCFFAEDTGIFEDNQFTNAVASHTASDGSDLQGYLQRLFKVLNSDERSAFPQYLQDFPYVNGGLFKDDIPVPQFTRKARELLVESGSLNWKEINPDIFGSMIQAVVRNEKRSSLGMHYTSVVNIMKVIKPLFLDELYEALEKAGSSKGKLNALLDRLHRIRIFDPACGSGNFLIIAYKELCKLEIEILKRLHAGQLSFLGFSSKIKLTQFYGIELDDFAHETAKLSLWLAEHQMNLAFREVFGVARPTLPLQDGGNIVCGNATRIDWEEVCSKDEGVEIYILGNPPYVGSSMQDKVQKDELATLCKELGFKNFKNMDYISCWFIKAKIYLVDTDHTCAFVSTNSVCQGDHVALLWPFILNDSIEIGFAHRSFLWTNNAKGNAGVTCIIVGLRTRTSKEKFIYDAGIAIRVKNINAYLINAQNIYFPRRKIPICSAFPVMEYGNKPTDGGHLILTKEEKENLISECGDVSKYIKKFVGSAEFIKGHERWCIWVTDDQADEAKKYPCLERRFKAVYDFRKESKAKSTVDYAKFFYKFKQVQHKNSPSLIVPRVSSERRAYIPIGFLDNSVVVSDNAQVINDPLPYIFAVMSSHIHMTWVRTVAGRLKTDYRYSSTLCYNTFPFPEISKAQEEMLEEHVFNILDIREQHSEKTMAQLYDPDKMPKALLQAHHEMDLAVERCYREKPFIDDDERIEYLFDLYEKMIAAEKRKGAK